MTRPYSWALKSPRSKSGTDQMRVERLAVGTWGLRWCAVVVLGGECT